MTTIEATAAAERAASTRAERPPPVLVIDDDPAGAATTVGWLVDARYPTVSESDGDAVLRLVRARAMRLVISELYIPCAEGACVVTALKQDRRRLPRLRVLVQTRHIGADDDARALAAGCDALLHKPTLAAAFIREVQRLDGLDPPREPGYDDDPDDV
jgi:two-component system sensor histidine kinase BarA